MNLFIFCDGGANNIKRTGYGSFEILDDNNILINKSLKIPFGSDITSNIAEYLSLIHSLRYLINKEKDNKTIICAEINLIIRSDSMLMVSQINRAWKCKNPKLKELLIEVSSLLNNFGNWEIKWIGREKIVERFGH